MIGQIVIFVNMPSYDNRMLLEEDADRFGDPGLRRC